MPDIVVLLSRARPPCYISFCDNMGSHFSLIKGMSRDPEVNALVGLFWAASGILGVDPWIEYVPTKAQLADAVSRQDVSEANALGWHYVPMDLTTVWQILLRACVEPDISYDDFAREILVSANTVRAAAGLRPIEGGSADGTSLGGRFSPRFSSASSAAFLLRIRRPTNLPSLYRGMRTAVRR